MFETDIVNADIPCLLSKSALKWAGTVLRLDDDKAEIYGNKINLDCTSSGHYALEIENCKNEKVIIEKNTLAMNNGFSPLQLVTGKNQVPLLFLVIIQQLWRQDPYQQPSLNV